MSIHFWYEPSIFGAQVCIKNWMSLGPLSRGGFPETRGPKTNGYHSIIFPYFPSDVPPFSDKAMVYCGVSSCMVKHGGNNLHITTPPKHTSHLPPSYRNFTYKSHYIYLPLPSITFLSFWRVRVLSLSCLRLAVRVCAALIPLRQRGLRRRSRLRRNSRIQARVDLD